MNKDEAETVALMALAHIAGQPALLERLLALTGLTAEELKAGAAQPEILGGVLDFLLGNERDLLDFCQSCDLAPEIPARARGQLPGAAREVYEAP